MFEFECLYGDYNYFKLIHRSRSPIRERNSFGSSLLFVCSELLLLTTNSSRAIARHLWYSCDMLPPVGAQPISNDLHLQLLRYVSYRYQVMFTAALTVKLKIHCSNRLSPVYGLPACLIPLIVWYKYLRVCMWNGVHGYCFGFTFNFLIHLASN